MYFTLKKKYQIEIKSVTAYRQIEYYIIFHVDNNLF